MLKSELLTKNADEYIAMLAHDLKTPVKAQNNVLNLLIKGAFGTVDEQVSAILLNLLASNRFMQCLIENVLDNYRINKKFFLINKTKGDIRKTIEGAILNIGILSKVKNQTLNIKYESDNFEYFYDEIAISRVIINLLTNAFEYSRENSVIDILVNNDNNFLEISILSTCALLKNEAGINSGLGLGLNICTNIIKAHEGTFKKEIIPPSLFKISFKLPHT